MNKERNVIVQTCWDAYRYKFQDALFDILDGHIQILAGTEQFEQSVKTRDMSKVSNVNNIFLLNRNLLLQTGVVKKAILSDKLVLEMNPRILTNWLIIVSRRLLRKRTSVWGHFGGRTGLKLTRNKIRKFMTTMAGGFVIAYTDKERDLFLANWRIPNILVANNSLYFKKEIYSLKDADPVNFIYSGRLANNKSPDLVIRSFAGAKNRLPEESKLHVVGDGPLLKYLVRLASDLHVQKYVVFHGFVSEVDSLRELYANSIASISYGFVGLQCIQSLGMGTPLIYPKNPVFFSHAPEFTVLNSSNSISFDDSEFSLTDRILEAYQNRSSWVSRHESISDEIRKNYNVEKMAQNFAGAFSTA